MSVHDEVLAANEEYAASFGDKATWPCRRPAASPSSPAWTPASTRPSTPAWPRVTPT